ncbi:neocarzinostatin apoprotein domain-containing protein, partial [Lacibacter sp. H375]|uniref:immunoglobulin domain-containing protein n=1 Tax=Lacibacter sp. H375 TaxID=3133424 RepID=UPI0030C2E591
MQQLLRLSVSQRAIDALFTPFYFLFQSKKLLLRLAMLVMSVGMMSGVVGQATVMTDKPDYQPGDTVVITGTGWQPGETVTLDVEEDPKPATCLLPHDLVAVADAEGKIYSKQFLIKENHLGVTFTLTATGQSSGLVAVTIFKDALLFSSTVSLTSICPSTSSPISLTITNNTTSSGGTTGANSRLGSGKIVIPGFTITSVLSYTTSPSGQTFSVTTGTGSDVGKILFVRTGGASNSLDPGESITITFNATSPSLAGNYEFTTEAWVANDFTGTPYPAIGSGANPGTQPAVTVQASPSINSQPANQNITYGSNASFTVTATGAGTLTYQWQEYSGTWNNITNGGFYTGATTATLNIAKPTVAMSGRKYRVIVSGDCSPGATSDGNGTLTVNQKPITVTAVTDSKVYDGTTTS